MLKRGLVEISDHAQLVTYNVINIEQNDLTGHAVEPSEEEEDSTTNEVFYPGYPGIIIQSFYILLKFISSYTTYSVKYLYYNYRYFLNSCFIFHLSRQPRQINKFSMK